MEQNEKMTVELVTLKTVVELGFKNILEKLDGVLTKMAAMEVRVDTIEKSSVNHSILISEGKESRLSWQMGAETQAKHYVTKDQFSPVRMLVYGFTGIILTGMVVAALTLVLKK